jgi:uncharacterized membrane protein
MLLVKRGYANLKIETYYNRDMLTPLLKTTDYGNNITNWIKNWKGCDCMKHLTRYFFQGLIVLAPIVASIYIVYIIFLKVDGLLRFSIPGVGLLITVAVVTLIGFLASTFIMKKIFVYIEKLLSKLPLVSILYSSIKDLIGAFVGDKKSFDRPVLVNLGANTYVVGFLTRDDLEFLGLTEYVSVYLPQSYNFAGNLLVVRSDSVKQIPASNSDVMAFLVSGGLSGSKQ